VEEKGSRISPSSPSSRCIAEINRIDLVLYGMQNRAFGIWQPCIVLISVMQGVCLVSGKPIGYSWSYVACRTGHLVPIWQPCIGPSAWRCPGFVGATIGCVRLRLILSVLSARVCQYRTLSNYRNPEFLGPRIGDKVIFSLLIMSLYWGVGNDFSQVCTRIPNSCTPPPPNRAKISLSSTGQSYFSMPACLARCCVP
jgi:hypothetical protein